MSENKQDDIRKEIRNQYLANRGISTIQQSMISTMDIDVYTVQQNKEIEKLTRDYDTNRRSTKTES